jgi:hypothetical protein
MREIVCIGWDGRTQPIYRFHDELALPDHMRARPSESDIKASADFTGTRCVQTPAEGGSDACVTCGKAITGSVLLHVCKV